MVCWLPSLLAAFLVVIPEGMVCGPFLVVIPVGNLRLFLLSGSLHPLHSALARFPSQHLRGKM